MREVLRSLAPSRARSRVILISEGLVLEGLGSDVDEIAAIAADVRASLDVMLLDVPAVDVSRGAASDDAARGSRAQVHGLESLAGSARGALHRVILERRHAFAPRHAVDGRLSTCIAVEARPSRSRRPAPPHRR